MTSSDQRCLARVMFANQVYKANGFAFQQLFCDVQRGVHGQGFVNVRPQGAIGDQGNDGYIPAAGHYFQVYGPVDPDEKVMTAAEKLEDDFDKLIEGVGARHPTAGLLVRLQRQVQRGVHPAGSSPRPARHR